MDANSAAGAREVLEMNGVVHAHCTSVNCVSVLGSRSANSEPVIAITAHVDNTCRQCMSTIRDDVDDDE